MLIIFLMTIMAYLLGSLSAAILVSRFLHMNDPRSYGSNNPGASNVLRSGRKDAAILTLVGDAIKGTIVVLAARALGVGDTVVSMAMIAVIIGHMYPLYFDFKGGKGVATAFGVILGISFWTAIFTVAIWLLIAFKFKKSSLAALVAAICAPFIFFILQPHHPQWGWTLVFITVLVLYRHKDNISRLRTGNELSIETINDDVLNNKEE